MPRKPKPVVFRITDNDLDETMPLALVGPDDVVRAVGPRPWTLNELAFDLGADEVTHEYNPTLVEDRLLKGMR